MDAPSRRTGSTARVLLTHGVLILIPVILLGVGLSLGIRGTAESRGLAEAQSEADLVEKTAVAPHFPSGRPLSEGLTRREHKVMEDLSQSAVTDDGPILQLRLRDEQGSVVFAPGAPAEKEQPTADAEGEDDDAVAAAAGG